MYSIGNLYLNLMANIVMYTSLLFLVFMGCKPTVSVARSHTEDRSYLKSYNFNMFIGLF